MLSVPELAALFRVTETTVHAWTKAGMPVVVAGKPGRGHASQIDLRAAVDWYFTENFERLELDRARARLANEQADKTELENELRRSNVAEISLIAAVIDDLVSNAKTNLLALPRKIAAELEGMNVRQREETIERQIRQSLEQLSAYRPGRGVAKGRRADNARAIKAPEAADGERVVRRKSNPKPRGQRRTRKVENLPG